MQNAGRAFAERYEAEGKNTMRSMTGYGCGEARIGESTLTIEVRAVNHRFLDVRVRVSRELGDLGAYLEQLARERLRRGRFDITLHIDGAPVVRPVLDLARAREAYRSLCALRDELAPGTDVPLSLLASVPDLFSSPLGYAPEELRGVTRKAFDLAYLSLDAMRSREGAALQRDLKRHVDTVRGLSEVIQTRSPEVVDQHRRRLQERADRLRSTVDVSIDSTRLEQEIVLFAERADICEEITRLESHCEQFAALLEGSEACGRRLDFLLQEMAREANTISAKSPDSQITHAIVEAKAEIERMREQVQNIE